MNALLAVVAREVSGEVVEYDGQQVIMVDDAIQTAADSYQQPYVPRGFFLEPINSVLLGMYRA